MDSQTVSPSKVVSIFVKPSSVVYIIISELFCSFSQRSIVTSPRFLPLQELLLLQWRFGHLFHIACNKYGTFGFKNTQLRFLHCLSQSPRKQGNIRSNVYLQKLVCQHGQVNILRYIRKHVLYMFNMLRIVFVLCIRLPVR